MLLLAWSSCVAWLLVCGSSSLVDNHLLPGCTTELFSTLLCSRHLPPPPHTAPPAPLLLGRNLCFLAFSFFGTAVCWFFLFSFSSFDLITLPPFPVPYFLPRGLTPNGPILLMAAFEYRGCIPASSYLLIRKSSLTRIRSSLRGGKSRLLGNSLLS